MLGIVQIACFLRVIYIHVVVASGKQEIQTKLKTTTELEVKSSHVYTYFILGQNFYLICALFVQCVKTNNSEFRQPTHRLGLHSHSPLS